MRKNVASQSIGCQLTTAADGTNFTGSASVLVTGDNGTQAAGGGTVTHEGNGYHSYAPTQAETNFDHIAFTFTGTGAITATVQVYTRHDANLTHSLGVAVTNSDGTAQAGGATTITLAAGSSAVTDFYKDNVIRLVAGTGAGQSRVVTAYNGTTKVATVHEAWATNPDSTSQYVFEGNADVGSGSAPSAADIWSYATRTITGLGQSALQQFLQSPTDAGGGASILLDSVAGVILEGMAALDTGRTLGTVASGSPVLLAVSGAWDSTAVPVRTLTAGTNIVLAKGTGVTGFTDLDAAGVRSAVGLASANLDTQLGDLPTASEVTTAVWAAGTRTLTTSFPTNFGSLAISAGGVVSADVKAINAVTLGGTGVADDEWGPA